MNFLTRPREDMIPQSLILSQLNISTPSASCKDLGSTMAVSELRGRGYHEEPTFRSSPSCSKSAQPNPLSSISKDQRLNPPLRWPMNSDFLNPTYTPLWYSAPGQREGRGPRGGKRCSSRGHSKADLTSPHKANHWACAIPEDLPPSQDRHCANWDPNREYQALLDYTYPLNPGQVISEVKPQGHSLMHADLQDSGIELDHHCSSTSLTQLDCSVNSKGQTRERSNLGWDPRSPDLPASARSSYCFPCDTLHSLTDPVHLFSNYLDSSKERGGLNHYESGNDHALNSSTSSIFIHSTRVLSKQMCGRGEVDEEFWPLPNQLKELQLLSKQVGEVTAQLSQSVTASLESLEPGTTSVHSNTLPEKREDGDKGRNHKSPDTERGEGELCREDRKTNRRAGHKDSEAVNQTSGTRVDPVGVRLNESSLRRVEDLVAQLCGLIQTSTHRNNQEDQEQSDSLMRHIQVFCSHLEQFIHQLYTLSEKMELLAPPNVDINSVQSSLAEAEYHREVSSNQPRTSCVLHSGQLLLSSINSTSLLLRDTLQLIEKQSRALQAYTEDRSPLTCLFVQHDPAKSTAH